MKHSEYKQIAAEADEAIRLYEGASMSNVWGLEAGERALQATRFEILQERYIRAKEKLAKAAKERVLAELDEEAMRKRDSQG